MSSPTFFSGTASAALDLYEDWVNAAERHGGGHAPSLLELQTVCRQTGCALPDLDSYVRAGAHSKPGFLLCGGNAALATDLAGLFGYSSRLVDIPATTCVWNLEQGASGVRVRCGESERVVPRDDLPALIASLPAVEEMVFIEERSEQAVPWRFTWVPHPKRFHAPECTPAEIEVLLSQRASVVLEDTPAPLQEMLEGLGQKRWVISEDQLSTDEERQRLFVEVSTLRDDRPEDLDLRAGAAWTWLAGRLLEQIAQKKRNFQQMANQYEIKLSSTRHLLSQYRKNWTGGVRSLTEAYLQNRTSGPAFAPFFDVAKPGPETTTYVAALGFPTLWTKLDEYVVDRMADFIAGLTGLAAKLELRQISLGDANARWAVRSLNSKLEAALNQKRIFPSGGGKRGGLVGNLTGRKQAVLDDRKAQILKASRLTLQSIETEFAEWAAALTTTMESGIALQLTAALANRGFSDADSLRSAAAGLDRLERIVQGEPELSHDPQVTALEWLRLLASRRWIPLYQPQ